MFESIFATSSATQIELAPLLACVASALALGIVLAALFSLSTRHTSSFAVALAVLPAIVCVVIALVNGNVGAGVAVMGAFSLVRFRSAPGTAQQIVYVFLAMCVGLAAGMGYVGVATVVTAVIGGAAFALVKFGFGSGNHGLERTIRVTVPEDLDFTDAFDGVLATYATNYQLKSVRTAGMGTLYKLTYNATLRPKASERELLDELRQLNGNLEIIVSSQEAVVDEL